MRWAWTVVLVGFACGSQPATTPAVSSAELEILAKLSPATLPPPPQDVSNKFADDAAAAHLGQKLFFDTSFAGPLVDPDNDGTPASLGKAGQTGRVACAGCHLPA